MLYVFIVSSGTTVKLDMNLAVKKVSELKAEVFRYVHIPVEDQVLLCSGGEELQSDNIVGNYFGAGTDTNPIFLFRKNSFIADPLSNTPIKTAVDLCIEDDVMGCANMIPCINTITVKASLAQRFAESALEGKKECNELVHQQHLQQQGWAAVMANLDDAKDALRNRYLVLVELFEKFLDKVPRFEEILSRVREDVSLLGKVPILPKLIDKVDSIEQDAEGEHTLLSWFCTESQDFLETLVGKCQLSVTELSRDYLNVLKEEYIQVQKRTDNPEIKEFRGIEERLSKLNKLIDGAEKLCKDQNELKGIFSSDRIGYARDPNVLPDVCRTYQDQLLIMLHNHKCLREILERCTKAKRELSENINFRVTYISHIENEMYILQVKIMFIEKHLKSVTNQIESFNQVHLAPQRYMQLCAEVCRRKEFSSRFLKWATELSSQSSKLYQNEISLRKSICNEESRNMVDSLFSGMDCTPPPFAIECPRPFDQNLPDVTVEDLESLKNRLPELSHFCEVLPLEPLPCISQAGSDSAFSSNIPSSLKISSLDTSHPNILKMHAKISALQKFIQELHRNLQSDFSELKASVKEDLCEGMTEAAQIIDNINAYLNKLHDQVLLEKEEAVNISKKEFSSIENAYIHRLEVESQKLNDAENQITHYEERLLELQSSLVEVKHENEQLLSDLHDKTDLLKKALLENEVEFESYKNEMKDTVQEQTSQLSELRISLANALSDVTRLQKEKDEIQLNCNEKLCKEQSLVSDMHEKLKQSNEEILRLQRSQEKSKDLSDLEQRFVSLTLQKEQCVKELENSLENLRIMKMEMDLQKTTCLKELEENLTAKHVQKMDSIHSHYASVFENLLKLNTHEELPESELHEEGLKEMLLKFREKLNSVRIDGFAEAQMKMRVLLEKRLAEKNEENRLHTLSLQQTHEEVCEKIKSRITAENQVAFNEAINSLSKEKDAVIEDLRAQIKLLEAKQFVIKSRFEQYTSSEEGECSEMTKSDSGTIRLKALQSTQEKSIHKLKEELEPLLETTMTQSSIPTSQSCLVVHESVKKKLKAKEGSLQHASYVIPGQQSVRLSCFNNQLKVSMLSCNEGDFVLILFHEGYSNYVVLHFGQFMHFLHPESLLHLNLKSPPTEKGSVNDFVCGIVDKKEFCITKKKENRYKLDAGSRFYRVTVKPCDKDAVARIQQLCQVTLAGNVLHFPHPSSSGTSSEGGDTGSMSTSTL